MAVTHLALLLAAAMSSCCAWHLPALPAQHRAQYYVLHDDGAYKHGFDTGAGQWASAKADANNQVTGEWQAVDDAGQAVHWAYTAGIQGYVPVQGNAPGKAPVHVVPIVAAAKHVPVAPPSWHAAPVQTKQTVDKNAGTGDASYSFQYDAEDHSRQESSNKEGSVVGSYQFKADDGVQRRVDYVAGKDTGFVAKGDHLPVAPKVPAVPAPVTVAPQVKSWSQQASWSSAPSAPAPVPSAHSKAAASSQESTINADGSYKFQYVAEDHSRQESSDANGGVVGSYQFKADDGVQRRVDYVAGKDTGFVAKGDHLPVAPEAPAVPAVPATKSWSQTKQTSWSSTPTVGHVPVVSTHLQAPVWKATSGRGDIHGGSDGAKAFSYSYDAVLSSKQETSDNQGNVVGGFQYVDGAGQQRTLTYTVNGDEGFVAKGDHLPVAPVAPVVPVPLPVPVAPQVKSWSQQASWSSAPIVPAPVPSAHSKAAASSQESTINADGSYKFQYVAEDHSRQESSDAHGGVVGSYQFKADDGVQRRVDYVASKETGFVAKGDHLPVAPVAPVVPAPLPVPVAPQVKSWSQQASWSSAPSVPAPVPVAPQIKSWSNQASWSSAPSVPAPVPSAHSKAAASSQESTINADGSYKFQYVAEDHSRQESSDANGGVVGSYQFKADDGVQRRVDYVAGKDTGFVAKGDHLPVAPAVPAAPAPAPVAPQVKSWSSQASWSSAPIVPAPVLSAHSKAAASSQESTINADGSYKFQYVAEDHSRQESSDAHGGVVGSYQFKADDGVQRRVDYVAGKDTGFVAKGDHLPVAPEVPAVPVAPATKSWSQSSWSSSVSDVARSNGGGWSRQDQEVQGEVEQPEETSQEDDKQQAVEDEKVLQEDEAQRAKDEAIAQADAQALDAEQQANQQLLAQQEAELQAQAQNAQSDSAQAQALAEEQEKQDRAEQAKFEAERNAELEGLKQEEEQRILQEQQKQQQDEQQVQEQWQQQDQQQVQQKVQQQWQQQDQVQQVQQKSAGHSSNVAGSDGYSFSYETDTQSVQQQAGAGNVARGSYSFVAPDDRQWRTVDWTAAAGTGFVAKGNHLPVAPLPQEQAAPATWKSSSTSSKSSTGGVKAPSHDNQDNGDGSYSYSYKTDNAAKQEVADKDGSVTGSFSYHGPDGVLRQLDYTANDKDGFVAKGDHLPGSTSGGHVSTWTSGSQGSSGGHAGQGAKSWSTSSGAASSWGARADGGVKGAHVSTGTSGSHSSHGGWGSKTASAGVRTSSTATAGSWGAKTVGGGYGSKPAVKHFPEVEVTRYLPPGSPKKFGYAFEAKA